MHKDQNIIKCSKIHFVNFAVLSYLKLYTSDFTFSLFDYFLLQEPRKYHINISPYLTENKIVLNARYFDRFTPRNRPNMSRRIPSPVIYSKDDLFVTICGYLGQTVCNKMTCGPSWFRRAPLILTLHLKHPNHAAFISCSF